MRRPINPEADLAETSANAELQQTFALLLPIRRQRLSRSERAQREQERALREANSQREAAEMQLEVCQQRYHQLRDSFAAGVQPQQRLMQGLNKERTANDARQGQQRQLEQCQQRQTEQQQRLAQAQQETLARQRELEKLEYLIGESEVLQ